MSMMETFQISFVKAVQDFFTKPPFGKKVEISEFKDLTRQDKIELREMLISEGYDVAPLKDEVVVQT
jgi:hypothetical protein